MNTITVDSAEFATLPRTIRDLITQAVEIGGEVVATSERRFEFLLPGRMVGGARRLVNRAAVGYYVRDGKNIIGGSHEVRTEIAYWGRQSR
jgi:hypothetical protein